MATAIEAPAHRSSRRRIVLAVLGVILCVQVILSMAWPHVVPRLAFLPQPAAEANDGCNGYSRYYERTGFFGFIWGFNEETLAACPEG